MDREVVSILAESVKVAEHQLEAARKFDARALTQMTERRQDLLFELGLIEQDPAVLRRDDRVRTLVKQLRIFDLRLEKVLNAATRVLADVMPQGAPQTYGANGRLAQAYR